MLNKYIFHAGSRAKYRIEGISALSNDEFLAVMSQSAKTNPLTPEDYVKLRKQGDFPNWVRRANRAHINAVEQFGPFMALVLIAHMVQVSNSVTIWAAAIFFWARVVHAVVMIAGISRVMRRPI